MRTIDARITNAIAKFPATFGLKGHDGTFRISPESSYISTGPFNPYVVLYTQRLRDGVWQDFAKGTSEELAGQVRV